MRPKKEQFISEKQTDWAKPKIHCILGLDTTVAGSPKKIKHNKLTSSIKLQQTIFTTLADTGLLLGIDTSDTISLKKSRREEQKRFHGMRPSDHYNQRQQ